MSLQTVILLGLILGSLAQTPPCPADPCDCFEGESGTVINCRNKGLTEIPTFKQTSASFALLTLAHNDLTQIGSRAFYTANGQPLKVKSIDIEGNSISTVDDEAFTGMTTVQELIMDMSGDAFPSAVSDLTKLEVLKLQGLHISELPHQVLQPLDSLKVFWLKNCHLQRLDDNDFDGQARSLEELNFEDNNLPEVPKEPLAGLTNLQTLTLAQNGFTSLPADSFSTLNSLKYLDISNNGLSSIDRDAFRGLEDTLETLDMYRCRLHDINLPPLERLRSLKMLNLNNNVDIQLIPMNLFSSMNNLEELGLHSCSLTYINLSTFKGVESTLVSLDLASNDISSIASFTFGAFRSLEKLMLNIQDLSNTLTPETFRGLENTLKELNLEGTYMETDDLKAVSYLRGLQILKLSSNSISSLPDFIFSQLGQLKTLEFNTNRLTGVRPAAMVGLQNSLETIDLRTNQISTISHCTFTDFAALDLIYLANNPLQCDCHTRWLREWLDKYDDFEQAQFQWRCSGPDPHSGLLLKDVNAENMVCDDGEEIEVCQEFSTPTPSIPPNERTTAIPPSALLVNHTNVTENSVGLIWQVLGGTVTSFLIEAMEAGANETVPPVFQEGVDATQRNITVDGLSPGTKYTLCVTAYYQQEDIPRLTECINSTTDGSNLPVTSKPSELAIILGSVVGVFLFIVLLVIVILVVRRTSAAAHPYDKGGLPESRADLPTMGYNSKRFSKPRSTMTSIGSSREDLERKLDGFTPEERNRILQLLSASTLSMASAGSMGSTRYLDEPRPHRWTGGASAYYNEEDPYHEIPQGEQYEYIPADAVTKYDYIPADQVKRPDPNEEKPVTPPPLPPPHPEGAEPPQLIISHENGQPPMLVFNNTSNNRLSQPVPHETHDSSEWI